jgi:DNA-binding LacI/PurR family transcriptional regulator
MDVEQRTRQAVAGRRVPDDVSVLGCEESDARRADPDLSCVNVTMSDVGAAAVDLLCRVSDHPALDTQCILVPPRLAEGKTCERVEPQTGG